MKLEGNWDRESIGKKTKEAVSFEILCSSKIYQFTTLIETSKSKIRF